MSDERCRDRYRLYWISDGGQVDAVSTPILASDDAAAMREAWALADGDRVELWLGGKARDPLGATTVSGSVHWTADRVRDAGLLRSRDASLRRRTPAPSRATFDGRSSIGDGNVEQTRLVRSVHDASDGTGRRGEAARAAVP